MSSHAERLFILQFGAERVAKGLSVKGGGGQLYWEPLTGVVVETSQGWVLLDSGMSRAASEDMRNQAAYAVAAQAFGATGDGDQPWHLYPPPPDPGSWTWAPEGDPLEDALAWVGLAPEDLSLAAVSHLHLDHSGGIPRLAAAGVPVAVQREELTFARRGTPGLSDGYHAPDWSDERTQWDLLDGDTELAPGVWALSTPGHTPGHMSFRVDLPDTGSWIFTADAADLVQNLYDRVPPGSCAGGGPADEKAAAASLERLLAEGRREDARLIPGHDQVLLNAVRHPPGGHT